MRKAFWTERKQSLLFGKLTITPTVGALMTLTDLGAVVAVGALVFVLGAAMAHEAPRRVGATGQGLGVGRRALGRCREPPRVSGGIGGALLLLGARLAAP